MRGDNDAQKPADETQIGKPENIDIKENLDSHCKIAAIKKTITSARRQSWEQVRRGRVGGMAMDVTKRSRNNDKWGLGGIMEPGWILGPGVYVGHNYSVSLDRLADWQRTSSGMSARAGARQFCG